MAEQLRLTLAAIERRIALLRLHIDTSVRKALLEGTLTEDDIADTKANLKQVAPVRRGSIIEWDDALYRVDDATPGEVILTRVSRAKFSGS
jgi:hypothetical protein